MNPASLARTRSSGGFAKRNCQRLLTQRSSESMTGRSTKGKVMARSWWISSGAPLLIYFRTGKCPRWRPGSIKSRVELISVAIVPTLMPRASGNVRQGEIRLAENKNPGRDENGRGTEAVINTTEARSRRIANAATPLAPKARESPNQSTKIRSFDRRIQRTVAIVWE